MAEVDKSIVIVELALSPICDKDKSLNSFWNCLFSDDFTENNFELYILNNDDVNIFKY